MPIVFDLEGDGLLDTITKIHCVCYYDLVSGESGSLSNPADIIRLFDKVDVVIGHNIIRFDIPALEKVFGFTVKAKLVDTLALSWYLEPERLKHGLEEWGEEFGVPKPPIDDWVNLPLEEYIHRCEEDVKINTKLW